MCTYKWHMLLHLDRYKTQSHNARLPIYSTTVYQRSTTDWVRWWFLLGLVRSGSSYLLFNDLRIHAALWCPDPVGADSCWPPCRTRRSCAAYRHMGNPRGHHSYASHGTAPAARGTPRWVPWTGSRSPTPSRAEWSANHGRSSRPCCSAGGWPDPWACWWWPEWGDENAGLVFWWY